MAGMELYVSTFGNDNWSGYLKEPAEDGSDGPFASLERAVIESRKTQGINKRIIIKGGEYYDVSIKLDSSDSGLCIEGAEGETPVLYGGIELNNWNETEDGMWYLKLPEVQGELWDFRGFTVNGRLCERARYPHEGVLVNESEFNVEWMGTTYGGWERKPTQDELTIMYYKSGDLEGIGDIYNADVTVFHSWDESFVNVKRHEPENRRLIFSKACEHPPGGFGNHSYVLWNVRKGISRPGQWYLDKENQTVYYIPLKDEDIKSSNAFVPTTTRVIEIKGNPRNLTVKNMCISGTDAPLMVGGFGASNVTAAIESVEGLEIVEFNLPLDNESYVRKTKNNSNWKL